MYDANKGVVYQLLVTALVHAAPNEVFGQFAIWVLVSIAFKGSKLLDQARHDSQLKEAILLQGLIPLVLPQDMNDPVLDRRFHTEGSLALGPVVPSTSEHWEVLSPISSGSKPDQMSQSGNGDRCAIM